MLTIGSNLVRESFYGTVYRVAAGAFTSTLDTVTDVYVISTYYGSDKLVGRANALLAMICTNMLIQLGITWYQTKKKSLTERVNEVFITLFFLRPAVDEYRVSTNYEN